MVIRRTKDWEKDLGKWIVISKKSGDITDSFRSAVKIFLWRIGLPAKLVFRK